MHRRAAKPPLGEGNPFIPTKDIPYSPMSSAGPSWQDEKLEATRKPYYCGAITTAIATMHTANYYDLLPPPLGGNEETTQPRYNVQDVPLNWPRVTPQITPHQKTFALDIAHGHLLLCAKSSQMHLSNLVRLAIEHEHLTPRHLKSATLPTNYEPHVRS